MSNMFSTQSLKDGLVSWGQTAASSGRFAFNGILFAKMGRMWKNKPNLATAVALGSNALNYAATKSTGVAVATALAQPFALRLIANSEIKAQKAENAAKSFGNVAKTFVKNNPISTAMTAGIAAIGAAQVIKATSQNGKEAEKTDTTAKA